MYNYHIIVNGFLVEENNFCPSLDSVELGISSFLSLYEGETRKIEIVITKQK